MHWKQIPILVLLSFTVSGCSDLDDPAVCPSGLICPAGTICAMKQDICIADSCGNGTIESRAGEVCDDGNIIPGDGCSQDCKSDEACSNGVIDRQAGEVCDDGNRQSGDGCSADCRSDEACGNAIVDREAGEVCDDGNRIDGDGCQSTCRSTGECQNGIVNPPEECDDGSMTASCDADCTLAVCGDNLHNPLAGEACDDRGNSANCDADCTPQLCSDGYLNTAAGEECDESGNTATCDADCTAARCGDAFLNTARGEICDSGGQATSTCDGDCTLPLCGDGWWNPAKNEQCDDGGNSPACDTDCTLAACGDGFLNPMAGETCDDGNLLNTDDCTAVCEPADCTDGFHNGNETDVDCGGHCGPASCEMLQSCSANADCAAGRCVGGTCLPDSRRLSSGNLHTCALVNSSVRCWGDAGPSQLGYGNTNDIGDNETPVSAGNVNVGGAVIQVAAGGNHTCALLSGGTVRCWGHPWYGRLGYGNEEHIGDNETPISAGNVNVGGTVTQIAAGHEHTCALLNNGNVRCWGHFYQGRLGYRYLSHSIGDDELPSSIGDVDVGGPVIQIAAGNAHTCALLSTGAVRCWGDASGGQLGYGNDNDIGDTETPASAGDVEIGGTVVQITAGGAHNCALLDTGAVRCWGYGSNGQLGYGNNNTIGDHELPASAGNVDVGGTVIQIAAGESHTCALLDTGAIRCWGFGLKGRLGYGNQNTIGDNEVPASAGNVDVGGSAIQIAAGHEHTCALLDTGAIRCWGDGGLGRLGYGNTNDIGDNEHPSSAGDVPYR